MKNTLYTSKDYYYCPQCNFTYINCVCDLHTGGTSFLKGVLTTGLFCLTYAVLSAYEWLATPNKEEHEHT